MGQDTTNDPVDYRQLVDNLNEGVFRFDAAGVIVDANKCAEGMLGYGPGGLVGLSLRDIHIEEEIEQAEGKFAARMNGIGGISEYRLRRRDGSTLWVSTSSIPMRNAAGACVGLAGFVRDIDAAKRAEAIGAHQLRLLRSIAGNVPLVEVLDDLCRTLESLAGQPLRCAVMILDDALGSLGCLAAPSLPEAFRSKAAYSVRDGSSACAHAIRGGQPVIIADALNDGSSGEVLALRREHGYAAVWSNPILQDGAPLGTLALLPRAPGTPGPQDTNLIEFGVEVARLALAHERNMRALRESEQRFRDYAELSADWYWEQDADFRFTQVCYGRESRPVMPPYYDQGSIGRHRWELPYINVPAGFWDEHRRQLEAGRPFSNLRLQRQTEGGLRHVEISGRPLFDETGRLAGYRGTGRDITDQVAAREELEKTKLWLEQAVRAASIGLWERDPDSWDFRFSANWKTLFGYADGEIGNTAEDFERLIHPDDLARIHATARAYTADPQDEYENRFRIRHKDGSWRWVLSRGSIVADPAMGRRTWMGCHLDITEQQRVEQALRESEALIARVFELLPVGVWIMDAAGRIVQSNDAGRRIWAGARYVGIEQFGEYKGWWLSSGKRIEPEEWAAARAIKYGETSVDEEIEIECFDGTRKIIFNSAMPLRNEGGAIIGGIIVNQDITARWRAEREVRELNAGLEERVRARTAELEEAIRELDAFNFSVSHDLRAPLRSIHGFSQALLEDYAARLDDEGRHYLKRICGSALRMGELIDAMYHLSKLSRSLLRINPVDLSGKAHALVEELRHAAPERAVEVAIAPGLAAEGDPGLLGILLGNLLANAWKYTLRTPQARIAFGSEPGEDGRTVFYVRDNGAGFDMQFADKLFRLFQRLHREEEFSGQGIGLVTAQRIVQRHGGRIWAEAAKGRGATFRFTLWENPAARRAAEAALQLRQA